MLWTRQGNQRERKREKEGRGRVRGAEGRGGVTAEVTPAISNSWHCDKNESKRNESN